ncbi:DegT/DnrJ/EryC1/StrS family aminotransferase [Paracoccus tegillarcae]|uniref:DegT/DnrJ/EryC1/StrS family aminotransferase n=1 Tax=Paracoccus tegillarcae TaxID=1529068 RepID=UPI0013008488|nr:DegT/DnrJ/EryC1/StrS family aminotransferase [Paracoccus tegillarcae]
MQILANDFTKLWQDCQDDYIAAVAAVGASGWYILGREVSGFEDALSAYCVSPFSVGCANGMDALEIALRVLGIGPGDKVLTTPLSAFATGLAILRAGAEPVYCDVDEHGALDPDAAAKALDSMNGIRAIIPVHLYGHMADIAALSAVADQYNVPIIEDAAQAIGASRNGVRVGAQGRIACFSFYPTKNLGVVGDGGALIVSDEQQATAARALRNYGQTEKYVHDTIGLNSRLDELHAATLNHVFLPKLDGWLTARRRIARAYLDGITNPNVSLLPGPDHDGSVWHLFPVLVKADRRDNFLAHLQADGIQVGLHYPILISDQRAMTDRGSPLVSGSLEQARQFATQEASLPIHPYLTDDEIGHVISSVNKWAG